MDFGSASANNKVRINDFNVCDSSSGAFELAGSSFNGASFYAYIMRLSETDGSLVWQETYLESIYGASFLSFSCDSSTIFAAMVDYGDSNGELNKGVNSYLIKYSISGVSITETSSKVISEGSFSVLNQVEYSSANSAVYTTY